jgi:hypothetical protein
MIEIRSFELFIHRSSEYYSFLHSIKLHLEIFIRNINESVLVNWKSVEGRQGKYPQNWYNNAEIHKFVDNH